MYTLNKRCEGEISPRIAFTNICSIVSDIYERLAPLKTGMEVIQMLKLVALWTKLLRCIERAKMGWELNEQCCIAIWCCKPNCFNSCLCRMTLYWLLLQIPYMYLGNEWILCIDGTDCSTTGTGIPIYSVEEAWQSSIWQFILVGRSFLFVSDTGVTLQSKVMITTSQTTHSYIYINRCVQSSWLHLIIYWK